MDPIVLLLLCYLALGFILILKNAIIGLAFLLAIFLVLKLLIYIIGIVSIKASEKASEID